MYRLALARPISTFVGAIALVVLGAFALLQLPVSLLPELERPRLVVSARAEDRSREEMLRGVVLPFERRLSLLSGITSIRSEVEDARARIVVESDWQADPDRLRIEAGRRIEGAEEIPLDERSVSVTGGDSSPIVEVAVLGGESSPARSAFAERVLMPELARLPGAGRVTLVGPSSLRAVVRPRAAALLARGITAGAVVERLRSVGQPTAAGRVADGATVRPLVIRDRVASIEKLGDLQVETPGGDAPLRDLAAVMLEELPPESSFRWNGEPAVLLRVFRAPGANAVALAAAARRQVDEIGARTRGGIRLAVASDRSREVVAAISRLGLSALAGILLGTAVLRFMLGRWGPTLALAVVIPASILISFAAFRMWGVPLDVVSLAGLALALGMLVDSSIVVLEAIESARARGAADAPLQGTRQVAVAVVASSITTMVVFVPLLYLGGLARAFFGEQAFSVTSAVAAALLLSLTLTPVLAGRRAAGGPGRSPGRRAYLRILDLFLRLPRIALVAGVAVTAVSLAAVVLLPRELLPEAQPRALRIDYRLSPELSPEAAEDRALDLERAVQEMLDEGTSATVTAVRAIRGLPEPDETDPVPTRGVVEIEFAVPDEVPEARRALALALSRLTGVRARISPRPTAFTEAIRGTGERVQIVVSAPDEDRTEALAARVTDAVLAATGLRLMPEDARRPRPAYFLTWDEPRLAGLGLDPAVIEEQVRAALGGIDVGRVDIAGVEPAIRVEATTPAELRALPVSAGEDVSGRPSIVPLSSLAGVEVDLRAPRTRREDGRPAIRLILPQDDAGPEIDAAGVVDAIAGIALAADETVRPGGEALEIARSFSQLRLALILSLILVYLTMAALYESLTVPLIIMAVVPVAAGGGLVALAATGQTLNVMSLLGVILLGGIVVNNAIVLVDRARRLRAEGSGPRAAARDAAAERYRPILMTTVTTVLGMLPLAILGGDGVELRRALSVAVLGGLLTSTFASLLLVPAMLCAGRRRAGDAPSPADGP